MLYLLYGEVNYLIDKEVEKIIKENNIDDINISRYDLDAYNYKDVIEDAQTISLFADQKLIIVDNASIFTSANKTIDTTIFEEYIDNYNPNTIIIFKLNESKLDERKKVTKLIRKKGTVKEYNKGDDKKKIVSDLFEDYKIDNNTISYLIDRVGDNIYILKQEIDKIKLYKGNDKVVTKDDITNLTSENIESDLFKLMDLVINNDKDAALSLYNEMLKYNLEPIQIIISLANKYRLMYQAKELSLKGYKEDEICSTLGQTNPKYMYVLIKSSKAYDSTKLKDLLYKLSELDNNIKNGSINKELAFELFILNKD